ncbi:MAG: hypothetical protein JETT_0977 [Candidatus Jettenia ecosi]|uniref:Uncharacterized protein n=1 Tax=Candidatus Jettenia ecosi TaxID=2494326 RepID=A0A533QDK4_9BACT|nr:MAG: hypothetical protein JETT_0977 [Candidatus Jettenia ecosi]
MYHAEELIEVYTLKDGNFILCNTYHKGDILESPYFKGLKIELKKIL